MYILYKLMEFSRERKLISRVNGGGCKRTQTHSLSSSSQKELRACYMYLCNQSNS